MAVPLNSIITLDQANDYAVAAINASTKVCPKASSLYQEALAEISRLYSFGEFTANAVKQAKNLLTIANQQCDASKVSASTPSIKASIEKGR